MGESSQKPIKIDGKLWEELDRWLKTPQAEKSGFHSKAQFATEAIRELLEQKQTVSKNDPTEIIYKLNSIESRLKTLEKKSPAKEHAE